MPKKSKIKQALRWTLIVLPLAAVISTSLLPLTPWVRQALVLITLLWFSTFYLFDCFYLGG